MSSLCFVAGTAAELIKMWPVMQRAEREGAAWTLLFTGQAPVGTLDQWREFAMPEGRLRVLMNRTADLRVAREALEWFGRAALTGKARLEQLLTGGAAAADVRVVVQGDTLSTLLGAMFGLRLGLPVAHIEAGLRTSSLREPFPEEISRRAVTRMARLHFAPEQASFDALTRERARGRILLTHGNTQLDALDAAREIATDVALPNGAFGLVNIHRFETLVSDERKAAVRRALLRASAKHPLQIVNHATTSAWLEREPGFIRDLESNGAKLLPRQPFVRFAKWLDKAAFVICDSGGNQEECDYLGKPCLLMRVHTERPVNPDHRCVVLSEFRNERIDAFIDAPADYQEAARALTQRPADIIWKQLRQF
jgi:UDP-N-acetylglucosamine 2-epimerase (non-hydrolysing)